MLHLCRRFCPSLNLREAEPNVKGCCVAFHLVFFLSKIQLRSGDFFMITDTPHAGVYRNIRIKNKGSSFGEVACL